jgi:pimeloyl-ACP methyl ester carboxylesterase
MKWIRLVWMVGLLAALLPGPARAEAVIPTATFGKVKEQASENVAFMLQTGDATFEPGPCDFPDTPAIATGMELECGWLTVPEAYNAPTGRTLRLAVAIIRSADPNPDPIPVIFLQGGPGGSTIDTYLQLIPLNPRLSALNRDVILFDQRGTLYSQPSLFCEETYQLGIDLLDADISDEEASRQYLDALGACRARLESEGVDLSAFDSLENAADVDALRRALGYDQVHLYGVSYGTLLALHVMRLFPEGLASVTIDSVMPTQVAAIEDQPRVIARGLDALFESCAADPGCSRAYPDLETVLYSQVDRLNADNARITLTNLETGGTYPALLDGDTVLSVVIQLMYATDLVPMIPRTIYQVRAGDYQVIETLLSNLVFDRSMSYGMFYSVWCAEEPELDLARLNLEAMPPQLADEMRASSEQYLQVCSIWDVQPLPADANAPVTSDIPTLVLSGAFDPVTPPEYAEQAAEGLSNAYSFVIPSGGHAQVTSGECQDSLFIQFMNDPTRAPDAACVADLQVNFSTPGALVPWPRLISLLNPQDTDLMLLLVYGLGTLFLLTAFVVYPLVWLTRWMRRPREAASLAGSAYGAGSGAPEAVYGPPGPYAPPSPPGKPFLYRLAPWLAALTGGMLLVFLVVAFAVALQMALANDNRILFGLPGTARPLFVLPLLSAVAVVLMLAGALMAWLRGAGSIWGRLYLTLLTLAGGASVLVLIAWEALQALFLQ